MRAGVRDRVERCLRRCGFALEGGSAQWRCKLPFQHDEAGMTSQYDDCKMKKLVIRGYSRYERRQSDIGKSGRYEKKEKSHPPLGLAACGQVTLGFSVVPFHVVPASSVKPRSSPSCPRVFVPRGLWKSLAHVVRQASISFPFLRRPLKSAAAAMPRPSLASAAPRPCFLLPSVPLSPSRASSTLHLASRPCTFRPSRVARPARPTRHVARLPPSARGGGPAGGGGGGGGWFPPPQKLAEYILRTGRFLQGGRGQVLLWGGLVWLVLSGRAGFIFDSIFFLFVLLTVVPTVGIFAFRWWVGSQTVRGSCPNCGGDVSGLKGKPFQCQQCGEVVKGEKDGGFSWGGEPNSATIDVDAINVDSD